MKTTHRYLAAALLGSLAAQPVAAHSWIDRIMRIAANGTMVGTPGYIRGYVSRDTAGYNDDMDTYLLPPNGGANTILANDSLCHSGQTIGNYSAEYPQMSAAAGDYIALRYQENGHVTLPDTNPTKPLNRGTVYIYGTTTPSSNELFADVFGQWTADGTGGNGNGVLLATRNFDDGQCYQINSGNISTTRQAEFKKVAEDPQGSDLWCQNDIQLPSNLTTGTDYTIYWVWSWPTMNKAGSATDVPTDGYNITTLQYYTSCMDISITASNSSSSSASTKKMSTSFATGQDLNSAAVKDQLTGEAFLVDVPGTGNGTNSGTGSGSGSTTGSTTSAASGTSSAASTQQETGVRTVVVTATVTEAPVYVTVTVSNGGSAGTATDKATTSSAATTFTTSTGRSSRSSRTRSRSSATSAAATTSDSTSSAAASATTSSAATTETTAAGTAAFAPGTAPSVSPFMRVHRVERVRRRW